MAKLLNRADTGGQYDNITLSNYSELTVEISALSIEKTANKEIWIRDDLEYNILLENIALTDPDDPLIPGETITDITLSDTIDPKIAALVANSVEIDGSDATPDVDYTYDPVSGLLTFLTLSDLAPGETHEITFLVTKVI